MMYAPAMAGVARPITLTDDERAQLTTWTRQGTTEQRMAQRARMVLEAAAGKPTKEIASRWGLRPATVSKWGTRFAKARLAGLAGSPPAGGKAAGVRRRDGAAHPGPAGRAPAGGAQQLDGEPGGPDVGRRVGGAGVAGPAPVRDPPAASPQLVRQHRPPVCAEGGGHCGDVPGPTGQRGGDKRGREARYPGPGAGPRMAEAAQWRGAARAYPRVQAAWDDDLVRGLGGPHRDRSRGPLPPAPTPGVPRLYEPAGGPVPRHRAAPRPGLPQHPHDPAR